MAHAYHLEALRKQRAIDRAYQARIRLEETSELEDSRRAALDGTLSPQRPGAPEPSTPANDSSRPISKQSTRTGSQQGSRPTSHSGSRPTSQGSSRPSSKQTSRPTSQKMSRPSSQSSSRSHSAAMDATEQQLVALSKDLHKKELVLRDNNLVMGHISPKEALQTMAE